VKNSPTRIGFELEDGSTLGGRIMAYRWYLDIPGNASNEEKMKALGITYVAYCSR
jgi:hypothetical protein